MKDRVGVVEDVFGADGLAQVAAALRERNVTPSVRGEGVDEPGREIGHAAVFVREEVRGSIAVRIEVQREEIIHFFQRRRVVADNRPRAEDMLEVCRFPRFAT